MVYESKKSLQVSNDPEKTQNDPSKSNIILHNLKKSLKKESGKNPKEILNDPERSRLRSKLGSNGSSAIAIGRGDDPQPMQSGSATMEFAVGGWASGFHFRPTSGELPPMNGLMEGTR